MPITIFGELYSLKNSKQIIMVKGRPMLIPSKAYNASVKPIEQQLVLNRYKWLKETENVSKPLKVGFKIYRKTHRKFDYQNILAGLADMMVRCGFIPDDNADEFLPIYEPYEVDKDNPRVEISVINQ